MDIVSEVREYVESECKKPTSKYGYEPFPFHFVPMVNYATNLAKKLGGDVEIIQVAGWLHDIGAIIYGREDHHLTGAKLAEDKLKQLGYPADKISLVSKCIQNHRGSVAITGETLEEKIIAEADVLSNFDNLSGIFKAAFVYESLGQGEAQQAVLRKLTNKYNQLQFPESKALIKPKFEAAKLLLGNDLK